MKVESFEIKVALLGYVSVGKTTVLNALLQDKFSEVSMGRTTAGINFFRISVKNEAKRAKTDESDEGVPGEDMEWTPEETREAQSTLKEIIADNTILRVNNTILEKTFDVELDEHICEMRPATSLVLVDIPGVNEAGSSQMYLDYVKEKWDDFDCVIVVMDAGQGVNTEEQVKLLEFVRDNHTQRGSRAPVIILGNKVDNPDDEEVMALVAEMKSKVQQLFKTICEGAKTLLARIEKKKGLSLPAFIPISAGNAFLYRKAHGLDFAAFKKLDKQVIDRIGRNEVAPSKWKKMNVDKKCKVAYAAVCEEEEYEERLDETNFHVFLKVLQYAIGGKETQERIIKNQIDIALKNLSWSAPLEEQLLGIHGRSQAVGYDTKGLDEKFFQFFKLHRQHAVEQLKNEMSLGDMNILMDQLIRFVEIVNSNTLGDEISRNWRAMEEKAISAMKSVVEDQLNCIVEKMNVWNQGSATNYFQRMKTASTGTWNAGGKNRWINSHTGETRHCSVRPENPELPKVQWGTLSPHDWHIILGSILLTAPEKHFIMNFGPEKLTLEVLQSQARNYFVAEHHQCAYSGQTTQNNDRQRLKEYLGGRYVDGIFEPKSPDGYKLAAQVTTPRNLDDPTHWGSLCWKFCQFMNRRDKI